MSEEGVWLSILDYAKFKNVSISTIRRHIKAHRVQFKQENGKYFIFVSDSRLKASELAERPSDQLNSLKEENRRLKEEINELKMLVELYEKGMYDSSQNELPPAFPPS